MSAESAPSQPAWATPAPPQPRSHRPWKLFGWIAALTLAVGAAAAVFLWLDVRPSPTVLLLVPSPSNDPFAPSTSTAQAFVEPFRERVPTLKLSTGVSRWNAALDELVAGQPRNVLLVVLGQGGCDEQGPFVHHDGSTERSAAIRVSTILDALGKLPARTPKLLIFDVTVQQAVPSRGQLHNGFAKGLGELDDAVRAIPNLVVVCSSGVDELSTVSEIHGRTAFQQAMLDEWSARGDALADGRLFTNEWLNAVSQQTNDWSREHRAQAQTPLLLPVGEESQRRCTRQYLGTVSRAVLPDVAPRPYEPSAELTAARQRYIDLDRGDWHPAQWVGARWMRYGSWLMQAEEASVLGHTQEVQRTLNEAEQERSAILRERDLQAPAQTTALTRAFGATTEERTSVALLDNLHNSTEAKRTAAEAAWANVANQPAQRNQATRDLLRWLAVDPLPRRATAERAALLMEHDADGSTVERHSLELFLRHAPKGRLDTRMGLAATQLLELRVLAEECWSSPGAEAAWPWFRANVRKGDTYRCPADDHVFATGDTPNYDKALAVSERAREHYSDATVQFVRAQHAQRAWATAPATLLELVEVLAAWPPDKTEAPPHWQRELRFRLLQQAWDQWFVLHDKLAAKEPEFFEPLDQLIKTLRDAEKPIVEAVEQLLTAKPATDRSELIRRGHLARACLKWAACPRRTELLREWHRIARELYLLATTASVVRSSSVAAATEESFAVARWRGLLEVTRWNPNQPAAELLRFRFEQFARQTDPHRELMTASTELEVIRTAVKRRIAEWKIGTDPAMDGVRPQFQWPYLDGPEPMIALRKQRAADLLHWQAERTEAEFFAGLPGALPYYQQAAKRLRKRAEELWPASASQKPASGALPVVPVLPRQRIVTDEASPEIPLAWKTTPRTDLYAGWLASTDGTKSWLQDSSLPGDARTVSLAPPQVKPPLIPRQEFSTTTVTTYFRGHITTTSTAVEWHRTPHQVVHDGPAAPGAAIAIRGDPAMLAKLGQGAGQLVFAVDATGSLAKPDDDDAAPAPFQKVCDTLAAVLEAVPTGVHVSVLVFGHRLADDVTPENAVEVFRKSSEWNPLEADELVSRVRAVTPWNQSAVTRQVLNLKTTLTKPSGAPQAIILLSDCLDNRFENDAQNTKKLPTNEALRTAFDDGSTTLHVLAVPVVRKEDQAAQERFAVTRQFRSPGLFVPLSQHRDVRHWIATSTGPRLQATLTSDTTLRTESLRSGSSGADVWSALVPAGEYRLSIAGVSTDKSLSLADGERLVLELKDGTPPKWERADPLKESKLIARDGGVALVRQRLNREHAEAQLLMGEPDVADLWIEENEPTSLRWRRATGWPGAAWDVASANTAQRRQQVWFSTAKRFPADGKVQLPLRHAQQQRINCGDGELLLDAPSWEKSGDAAEEHLVIRWSSPKDQPVIVRPVSTKIEHECRLYRVAERGTLLLPSIRKDSTATVELEFLTLRSIKDRASSNILNVPAAAPGLPFTPPVAR
jgi:hypothetical protein